MYQANVNANFTIKNVARKYYYSVVICDGVIEETRSTSIKIISTKNVPTKCTLTNVYILPAFLFITIALLIAATICLRKY